MSIQEDRWAVTALTGPEKVQMGVKRGEEMIWDYSSFLLTNRAIVLHLCDLGSISWSYTLLHQPIQEKCSVVFVVVCLFVTVILFCLYL